MQLQNIKTKDFLLKGTVVGWTKKSRVIISSLTAVTKPPGTEGSSGHCSLMRKSLKNANKMQGVM